MRWSNGTFPVTPWISSSARGHVHRFKGHAVRKNIIAARHPASVTSAGDPWDALFEAAVAERREKDIEVVPFWIYPVKGGAQVERHVPMLPFSREIGKYERLKRSLAAYRLAFGAPRQEEFVSYLAQRSDAHELVRLSELLRVNLSPGRLSAEERTAYRGPG
jgi:hypothetical protein